MNGSNSHNAALPRLLNNKAQPLKPVPMPKVAVCVPSGDMVHKGFAMCLFALGYMSAQHGDMPGIPCAIVGTEGSLVVRNRNESVRHARELGVDYLLFLDSDMTFPNWTLRRLLSHEKDIVGATYLQRDPPHRLLGVWDQGLQLTTDRLHKVDALPAGCLLIKMSVFDSMVEPFFRTPAFEATADTPAHIQGEDYYFCQQAGLAGIDVWLDAALTMELGHVGKQLVKIQAQPEVPEVAANEQAEVPDGQALALH